ncbi:MAG: alpha/beta hydrolase [Cyclobacteriaceae bacterium]
MKKLIALIAVISLLKVSAQSDSFMPEYSYDTKYITIGDDISMAYLDEGSQDAPVILMVHGLGGYIKNWYETIEGLKLDYRCIAIDLPGYGRSTVRDFQEEDYIEFFSWSVDQFVNELGLAEATLMGHSMGGQVSIVTALKKPNWLKNLILVAPAGFETFSEQEGNMIRPFSTADALMSHNEAQIRIAYAANFVSMPESVEDMIQDRLKVRDTDYFKDYAKVREMGVSGMLDHPVREELKDISVPTLVVFGAQDALIPNRYLHKDLTTEDIANIGKDIPDVRIKLIDQAGHMLPLDQPAAFNESVRNFLVSNY